MTQEEALTILKTGANVFLTGEPGSGKSHTIGRYVEYLRERGVDPSITASTGIAATHIGGLTIHSWSGIGIQKTLDPYAIDRIAQNERVARRIGRARVLIIDEVSMLSPQTLAMADHVCREIRHSSKPFGGLQVVLVGDFFQLPPVEKNEEEKRLKNASLDLEDTNEDTSARFAYDGSTWKALNPIICYLSEQHRQEDEVFLSMLGALRRGEAGGEVRQTLEGRMFDADGIDEMAEDTTRLFSHNVDVDRLNSDALSRIEGETERFTMEGFGPEPLIEQLKRGCLSPDTLDLKIGARVMFTKNNFDGGYVNGTTGEVTGFGADGYPIVNTKRGECSALPMEWAAESEGRVLARVVQVPLRLAWAMTVHKSQGMSLDRAMIDLSRAFEYGQGYVALSRLRTLEGLSLLGLNERALEVHPDVLKKDVQFKEGSTEAQAAFNAMSKKELSEMHTKFLKAIGGSPKPLAARKGGTRAKTGAERKIQEKESRLEQTLALILEGHTVQEVAKMRERSVNTIFDHLEESKVQGKLPMDQLQHLIVDAQVRSEVEDALREVGAERLRPVYERLEGKYPYETLRAVRLLYTGE